MTNFEKYKDELFKARQGASLCNFIHKHKEEIAFGISDDVILAQYFIIWLMEEYKEPEVDWSKVAVDTPIFVSDDNEDWTRRYFASYTNGSVYAWGNGADSWTARCDTALMTKWQYAKLAEVDENETQN